MKNIDNLNTSSENFYELRDIYYKCLKSINKNSMKNIPFNMSKIWKPTEKIEELINQVDDLKKCLDSFRPLNNEQSKNLEQVFDIEYTYDSNHIEGNTLTLQETALVIEKGITVQGKPLKEHLEVINHKEAIDYIKDITKNILPFNETVLKNIHNIILCSIDRLNAGRYRDLQVRIVGSKHLPPPPYIIQKLMEDYFIFYEENKNKLHPVILSADMHEKLVTIHPFIDGNGRTARLVMNFLLLQNGYPIANISGDPKEKVNYYNALESVQINNDNTAFHCLILKEVKKTLFKYLESISVNVFNDDETIKGIYFLEKIKNHIST